MKVTGHHIANRNGEFYGATPERLRATLPAVLMLGLVIFVFWDPARSTWLVGRLLPHVYRYLTLISFVKCKW